MDARLSFHDGLFFTDAASQYVRQMMTTQGSTKIARIRSFKTATTFGADSLQIVSCDCPKQTGSGLRNR
jgi:hypothetical protein